MNVVTVKFTGSGSAVDTSSTALLFHGLMKATYFLLSYDFLDLNINFREKKTIIIAGFSYYYKALHCMCGL